MHYYPLFLDLSSIRVLIAGAGEVGLRKAADILAAGSAELTLLDPGLSREEATALLPEGAKLVYEQRAVRVDDLRGKGLVFACTGAREVNRMLADGCREQGIPCNVIDAPEEGSFIVPSHFREGDFLLALSSGGGSPALVKQIRREIQAWVGDRYRPLLAVMARIRPRVLEMGRPSEQNRALFRALVHSRLGEELRTGNPAGAAELLRELLPQPLHEFIGDFLHEPL